MKSLSLLTLAGTAQAALRFGCSTLSVQRLDPVVQPGKVPSAHVHQIVGGNAFNATMNSAVDHPADLSTCTTCFFGEDFSNYWTAVMYFKARNGTYKRVPQYANAALEGETAGMTVYYTQESFFSNGNQKVTAFKPGFRMTIGNPTSTKPQVGLKYVCLSDATTRFPELDEFPKQPCKAGIMTVHHFPSCWDGKNLDSEDHQSHMYAGGTKDAFLPADPCPASHPVRVPQVALETLWDTAKFNDQSQWPTDGSQPFVWSFMGDKAGHGSHADYLFGWKDDSLQRAMDSNCMFQGCGGSVLKTQTPQQMNSCTIKPTVDEDIDGWLDQLPGHEVPMQ